MHEIEQAAVNTTGKNIENNRRQVDRIASFSDAVFAVAITLLVLNIEIPDIPEKLVNQELASDIAALWPHILALILSFVIIGFLWISHHNLFKYIEKQNGSLLWINMAILLSIVLLPFSTNVISEYGNTKIGVIIYAANYAAACLLFAAMWYFITKSPVLVSGDFNVEMGKHASASFLLVGTVFLVSIGLALVNPQIAEYFWLTIIPINIFSEMIAKKRRASPNNG
ncbi:MAG: DUF1211 domain-containing protein [Actinobacteria bacterium]|nr:DUF1211 domain-containing protein [Actinomycetota bacterium]